MQSLRMRQYYCAKYVHVTATQVAIKFHGARVEYEPTTRFGGTLGARFNSSITKRY